MAVMIAIAVPQLAHAQTEASAPENEEVDSATPQGEIIVTAQKRSQRVADIPISITALSGATLEKLRITQSDQLVAVTPGLAWGGATGKSKPAIFLRGVGVDDYHSTSNSPVGTYSDGVYMGNSFGYGQLVLDLDRIEVLRGPQGTLWGKNTTGGVINYIPRLAEVGEDANMSAELGVGKYGGLTTKLAAGIPLTDTLAVRVAFGRERTTGYYTPVAGSADEHGKSTWYGVRGSIAYEPSANVSIVGELNYSNLDGEAPPMKLLGTFDPATFFNFAPCTAADSGQLGTSCVDAFGYSSSADPYETSGTMDSTERVTTFAPILKIEIGLGDYTLNSLTSYSRSKRRFQQDADFSPSPYQWNFFNDDFESGSQELRLSSPTTGKLSWMLGLYGYNDKAVSYNTSSSPAFAATQIAGFYTNKSQSYGAFADATYHVTEKLNVTVGARYTRDQRQFNGRLINYAAVPDGIYDQETVLANNLGPRIDFSPGTSRSDDNLSGRIVADYHFTDRFMAFASFSRGFKGGDANSGAAKPVDFYITGPEHLTAYEAGIKGDIIPGLLTTETSGFYYDYRDAQVYIQLLDDDPNDDVIYRSTLSNAGKVKIYGIDGNLSLTPTRNLTVDFNYAYLNSSYTSYQSSDGTIDYSGNVTPFAAKWQLNGRISHTLPLGGEMSLDTGVNVAYRSMAYFTSDNDPIVSQPAYTLVDLNASLNINKNVSISGWIKNVTDKFYWSGGYSLAAYGVNFLMPGAPRTFGGSVRLNF